MTSKKSKRRRFLVDRPVQYALGLRIASHWAIFLIASVTITTTLQVIGSTSQTGVIEPVGNALRSQLIPITVLLALLPWFIHDSLTLSNRFAGPMVRLRASIQQLQTDSGMLPIKFRKGDFWAEAAEDFNRLRALTVSQRAELNELRAQLQIEAISSSVMVPNFSQSMTSANYQGA